MPNMITPAAVVCLGYLIRRLESRVVGNKLERSFMAADKPPSNMMAGTIEPIDTAYTRAILAGYFSS